ALASIYAEPAPRRPPGPSRPGPTAARRVPKRTRRGLGSDPARTFLSALGIAGLVVGHLHRRWHRAATSARPAEEDDAGREPVDEVASADRPDLPAGEEPGDRHGAEPRAEGGDVVIGPAEEA